MNFKQYHVSKNLLSEKYENRSINGSGAFTIDSNYDLWLGEVVAGQTYTISNMDYVYGFFATKPMPNTGATYDGSRGYEMFGTTVVTVPSGCTWVAVRVLHNANNAMLNTGSQPLPYEPYSSEVWHDTPHYIHNTSTDTITTLPAVLYPNAVTATVGLKGNMSQTGTPTPQNPIYPSECGDLETTGEHAGQYKIPISSANTTTPVYLGEVETTRMIKKLVLTGEENIAKNVADPNNYLYYWWYNKVDAAKNICKCTHLEYATNYPSSGEINSSLVGGLFYFNLGKTTMDAQTSGNTATGFKEYLAAQYANGTPVTIWYILTEPTTGVVNEPLRKIGDYADTVSGITIPTIAGANSFDVLTTLKPSEVTVNYKGWHPVADVHERESGAWT